MSGKSKVLNIEIGRRLTKVCLSNNTGKGYQIKSSFTFDTPEGAFADGQINNAVDLWRAMRKELRAHNVADVKDAIFTLASNRIASREVLLPLLKDNQIQSAVESNAFEWFPVDISKYSLGHMVLGRTKENTRINVVAVPLFIVESYTALAEQSGLNIVALDFAGNSQYQVLKTLPIEGVTMFVNVEPSSSLATFMENGSMLMQRGFAFGGDEMVSAIVGEGSAYVDALNELCGDEVGENSVKNKESLERLVTNVARSADFFQSNKTDARSIDRVVLMGTCSHLFGLKEAVAARIGCEALWLEEIEGLNGLANSISGISTYIGCVGSNIAPLPLLPKQMATDGSISRGRVKEGGNYGVLVLTGCVLLSAVLTVTAVSGKNKAEKELKAVNDQIDSISYVKDVYDEYLVIGDGAAKMEAFYSQCDTENANLRAFLEELQVKMPATTKLLSMTADELGISLTVTVSSFEDAASVLNQLSGFESVEKVVAGTMSEMVDDAGFTQVQFDVSCFYFAEEESEEAPVDETVDDEIADDELDDIE